MLVCAPDSSRNTRRSGATSFSSSCQAARRSATSGRSCSEAWTDFFKREPEPLEPLADRLKADVQAQSGAEFLTRGVGARPDVLADPTLDLRRDDRLAAARPRQG